MVRSGTTRHRNHHRRHRFRRIRWRRLAAATASTLAAAPVLHPGAAAAEPGYAPGVHEIVTTAYCLDGHMANGEPTHDGVAAMRGVPLGTSITVLDGPQAGRTLTVEDRLPKRGVLDIWMDDCAAARDHGAHRVNIEVHL